MLASPKAYARTCGAVYACVIVLGIFAEFYVRGSIVVHGDAVATAAKIAAHETLWRAGMVANLLGGAAYVVVTLMLYVLLEPVDKRISLLAAFFSIAGCAMTGTNVLLDFAALSSTAAPAALKTILGLHLPGYCVSLAFFGFYCALLGYLIVRSGYLPKFVGALLLVGGPCYVLNSCMVLLAPAAWAAVPFDVTTISGVAELVLTLWLLAMGVDVPRWNEKACTVSP
ncbi:MAG: DUF4386 domain-containing protein [Candidatus Eremiobacteraeota bacterium]|nr:DUF4386 domain-containing protein [Candidatus Eremiobacteraeota bacterium]